MQPHPRRTPPSSRRSRASGRGAMVASAARSCGPSSSSPRRPQRPRLTPAPLAGASPMTRHRRWRRRDRRQHPAHGPRPRRRRRPAEAHRHRSRGDAADLFERLSQFGADAAEEALDLLAGGDAVNLQDESSSLAPKLTKDDGRIDFTLQRDRRRHVRAMTTAGRPRPRRTAATSSSGGSPPADGRGRGSGHPAGRRDPPGRDRRRSRAPRACQARWKAAMADDAFQRGARVERGSTLGG